MYISSHKQDHLCLETLATKKFIKNGDNFYLVFAVALVFVFLETN